ncbi:MAG TPA: helix-turn-helix transcriptional regulator [Chitinophaga sp.]|uniref:AraC family transcriptional regulator n=1 Tax=Chitinophaga sp. TaxID=1869181 RepID=UPI002BF79FD7|nr:helix-turn-helix transcriptional regulator [Chitinophaga sp.]HVI43951.1 helix-turn-helix transcriptional regulator [Chitinophaga sp.]
MKTDGIAVIPVAAFHAGNQLFWTGSLDGILEKYPWLEKPHRPSFYMLLCIERAQGTAAVDNETIRLDQGKVICVKPNSVFSLDINRMAAGSIICFAEDFFSLRYNSNVLYQFSFLKQYSASFIRLSQQQVEKWQLLTSLMYQEFKIQQKGAEKVLRSYLNILLCELDRRFGPEGPPERISNKMEKIRQFEVLMEQSYVQHKIPSFYASQLHITTNYLNRLCRQYKGVSSGELIRKRVVIEAQRLLHYTALSVSEVANVLGFDSTSYFVTFFRKNTGATPESFRRTFH